MKTLHQIATTLCGKHELTLEDLRAKTYHHRPKVKALKHEFILQARKHHGNLEVAEFLGYAKTTASTLYTTALGDKPVYKWQRMLKMLKEGGAVTEDEISNARQMFYKLREKGYHVYRNGNQYLMG